MRPPPLRITLPKLILIILRTILPLILPITIIIVSCLLCLLLANTWAGASDASVAAKIR